MDVCEIKTLKKCSLQIAFINQKSWKKKEKQIKTQIKQKRKHLKFENDEKLAFSSYYQYFKYDRKTRNEKSIRYPVLIRVTAHDYFISFAYTI